MAGNGMWRWTSSVWIGSTSTVTCRTCRSAGRWCVHDRAPGPADPLAGDLRQDRAAVPPGGRGVRRGQRHPGGPVRQGRSQDRRDAPLPRGAGRDRPVRVAAIGVAQEFQRVSWPCTTPAPAVAPHFGFAKADRRVSVFYFYLWDQEFGPGFIKVCTYFPYPMKIWVNGHEWAKRQAAKPGSGSPRCPTASPPATTRRAAGDL